MLVECIGHGKRYQVFIFADNLLFYGLFLSAALDPQITGSNEMGGEALILMFLHLIPVVGLLWVISAIFARWTLWRSRARRLPKTTAPWVWEIVHSECRKMYIHPPKVFWSPTIYHEGARVLGGFRRKLLLTGGLCVKAGSPGSRSSAEMIIRHELAHLTNKDTRLMLLVPSLVLYVVMFAEAASKDPDHVSYVFVGFTLTLATIVFLLRRREFLADAIAINASPATGDYSTLITDQQMLHGGLFHPAPESRLKAIKTSSPVLRISITMLLLICASAASSLFSIYAEIVPPALWGKFLRHDMQDALYQREFPVLVIWSLCLFFELLKGFSAKTPTPLLSGSTTQSTDRELAVQG